MKTTVRIFYRHIVQSLCIWTAGIVCAVTPAEQAFMDRLGRDCKVVELWPGGIAPNEINSSYTEGFKVINGEISITPVLKPSMFIIPPPEGTLSTGVTLVLCPGGGYGTLGTGPIIQEAGWLNAMGATAVLLEYRVPPRADDRENRLLPLSDAQRAIGLLRSRAGEWGLDPKKIGIGGFSAGGHLACNLACHSDKRVYNPVDKHDEVSCRPDFVVLHYAAYLTSPIDSLTATPNLDLDAIESKNLPPVFSTITRPDKFTYGCVNTMWALCRAKVPNELHIYCEGGHGGCLDKYPLMEFVKPLARFLKDHNILDEAAQQAGDAYVNTLIPAVRAEYYAKQKKNSPSISVARSKLQPVSGNDLSPGERKILGDGNRPVFRLWPADAGASSSMSLFKPEHPDGRAALIFPSGDYSTLSDDRESIQTAGWLNGQGITAFVVKYCALQGGSSSNKYSLTLEDAQRAIRLVRAGSTDFGIRPDKIGVLGGGAGGYLAALACMQHQTNSYSPADEFDKVSCRPDFGMLIYPDYLAENGILDPLLVEPKIKIVPPIYITTSANARSMNGATLFLLKLREGKISTECHVYEKMEYGHDLQSAKVLIPQWMKSCERWLTDLEGIGDGFNATTIEK